MSNCHKVQGGLDKVAGKSGSDELNLGEGIYLYKSSLHELV